MHPSPPSLSPAPPQRPPDERRHRRGDEHRQGVHLLVRQQVPAADELHLAGPPLLRGRVLDDALPLPAEPRGLQHAPQDGVEQGAQEAADGAERGLWGVYLVVVVVVWVGISWLDAAVMVVGGARGICPPNRPSRSLACTYHERPRRQPRPGPHVIHDAQQSPRQRVSCVEQMGRRQARARRSFGISPRVFNPPTTPPVFLPAPTKAPPATEARVPVHETPPLVPRGTGWRRRKEVMSRGALGLRMPISEALLFGTWVWGSVVCGVRGEGGRCVYAYIAVTPPIRIQSTRPTHPCTHAPRVPVAAGVVPDVGAQQLGAQRVAPEVERAVVGPQRPGVRSGDARREEGAGQDLFLKNGGVVWCCV